MKTNEMNTTTTSTTDVTAEILENSAKANTATHLYFLMCPTGATSPINTNKDLFVLGGKTAETFARYKEGVSKLFEGVQQFNRAQLKGSKKSIPSIAVEGFEIIANCLDITLENLRTLTVTDMYTLTQCFNGVDNYKDKDGVKHTLYKTRTTSTTSTLPAAIKSAFERWLFVRIRYGADFLTAYEEGTAVQYKDRLARDFIRTVKQFVKAELAGKTKVCANLKDKLTSLANALDLSPENYATMFSTTYTATLDAEQQKIKDAQNNVPDITATETTPTETAEKSA